jgi:hypothetical protein
MNFNGVNDVQRPELIVKLTRVHNNGDKDDQTYKLLGVSFDEYLSFNQHCTYVLSKLSKSLFLLNRSKKFLSNKALKLLYFSTVHCHLTYSPVILSIISKTNNNKLFLMQKKLLELFWGVDFHAHTAPLFLNIYFKIF